MSPEKIATNAPETINIQTLPDNVPPEQHLEREAFIGKVPRDVVALKWDYPSRYQLNWHSHGRNQLLYPSTGVITVLTDTSIHVVSPDNALFIPAGIRHAVKMRGTVEMRSLFLTQCALPNTAKSCGLVHISPMLREMLRHAPDLPKGYDCEGPDGRLMSVILEQIDLSPANEIHLPKPKDPFLLQMEQHLLVCPDDQKNLEDWATVLGTSSRTLARRFNNDINMTYRDWRLRIRLMAAVEHLAAGASISATAHQVGFNSESAFIDRFKKATGLTPRRYFQQNLSLNTLINENQP